MFAVERQLTHFQLAIEHGYLNLNKKVCPILVQRICHLFTQDKLLATLTADAMILLLILPRFHYSSLCSFQHVFNLHRSTIVNGRMKALSVVTAFNPVHDVKSSLLPCFVASLANPLYLQRLEEAFIWTSPVCQDISYAFTQVRTCQKTR